MSNTNRISIISAALALAAVEGFAASVTASRAVKAQDRNKDQKLAVIADDIAKLADKFDDVTNDRVTVRAAKAVYAPAVGDKVLATVGRNTATSQAKVLPGTVVAVKEAERDEAGKAKGATQVRVRINEGTFDEQLVTLYPAQLQKQEEPSAEEAQA